MLSGRRVLDLSRYPGGMFCARVLGWLGAEVTVIAPASDERAFRWEPIEPSTGRSLRYLHYNRGKKRVEVEFGTTAGTRRLLEEARGGDVLVEDWGGGIFERQSGVTVAELRRVNPRLVVCRISAFGQEGGDGLGMTDFMIQAAGGLLYLTGEPGLPPLRAGEDIGWTLAGLHAAVGAALALVKAVRCTVGDEVDVSAQAAVAVTLEAPFGRVATGAPSSRIGSRHYATCPCNIYRTQDGWVGVCANQDVQISGIVDLVGRGDLRDPIPPVDELRQNAALSEWFDALLEDSIKAHATRELVQVARRDGLLLAKVNEMPDLCSDPHVEARQSIRPLGESYPPHWRDVEPPFRFRPSPIVGSPAGSGDYRAKPLAGLTVIDFTWAWAGPSCTKFLASAGAEVIKVENPEKPDVFRRYPPFLGTRAENETSGFFADQNWNKKSVLLDMKERESLEVIKGLLESADVIVESFRPHVMSSWGLSFEDVLKINPRIVYASISGYGHSGPYSARPAYGALMECEGGIASLVRYSCDGRPYRTGTSLPDPVLGATAAVAVCAGLTQSLTTGRGVHVDVSMLEATLAILGPVVLSWTALGSARQRTGNLSWEAVLEGCYRCGSQDEWVALSIRNERDWASMCGVIGVRHSARNTLSSTMHGRGEHLEHIEREIEVWSAQRTKWRAAEELRRAGLAAYPVLTLRDLLEDRQLAEFGFLPTIMHPEMGAVRVLGVPFRMSDSEIAVTSPPPLLGQHTEDIRRRSLAVREYRTAEWESS